MIKENPEVITVRFIRTNLIVIEHNGVEKSRQELNEHVDDPTTVIKSIELTLATLGYELDEDNLYIDSDLVVANFKGLRC